MALAELLACAIFICSVIYFMVVIGVIKYKFIINNNNKCT